MTSGPERAGGFTLMEVIVAMAIIAILAAIAIPNYTAYVARGNRSEARATLLQAAQWMERFRTENNSYLNAALPATLARSPQTGTILYNIGVVSAAGTYALTATPTGSMSGDTCGNLAVDHTGARTAGGDLQLCWGR